MSRPGRRAAGVVAAFGCLGVLAAGCGSPPGESDVLASDLESRMPWEVHPPASTPSPTESALPSGPEAVPTREGGADDGGEDADPTSDPTPDASGDAGSDDADGSGDTEGSDEPDDGEDKTQGSDDTPDAGATGLEVEVVTRTEQIRADNGCENGLTVNDRLVAAARAHSADMAERDYFDHSSPEGDGPGDRAAEAGYDAWGGENIAFGYPTAQAVVDAWMDSAGHRANILNCGFVAIGVGAIADDDGAIYWTQTFGWE